MFRSIQSLSLALCIIASTANSAWAVNWVQSPGDKWFWIDMDSLHVRDGFTLYVFAHGAGEDVPPPAGADLATDAINCTTGEYFYWNESENRWQNRIESGQPLPESLRTLICNR